jgi:hypothetical protein
MIVSIWQSGWLAKSKALKLLETLLMSKKLTSSSTNVNNNSYKKHDSYQCWRDLLSVDRCRREFVECLQATIMRNELHNEYKLTWNIKVSSKQLCGALGAD